MSSFYDDASLVVIPSGYKTSKVYAEKPTDGSGDLTFTRTGDTATRVNSAGIIERVRTNLVLQSQTFDNAYWDKLASSVNANATIAPDGTLTAEKLVENSANDFHAVGGGNFAYSAGEHSWSVFAKAGERNVLQLLMNGSLNTTAVANFNLTTGVVSLQTNCVASIESIGNGWFRCSMVYAATAETVPIGYYSIQTSPTAARATTYLGDGTSGLFVWGAQMTTGVTTSYIPTTTAAVSVGPVANVPRLDYLGSTCPRLLLEPQRTNLVTYSEQFDNAAWTKVQITTTANSSVSPDGYANADKIAINNGISGGYVYQSIATTSSTVYTSSFFIKAAGVNFTKFYSNVTGSYVTAVINLTTGAITNSGFAVTPTATNYGNGWWRVSYTETSGGGSIPIYVDGGTLANGGAITGNGTDGILIWGCQLEQGAYSTSLIPTLAASATRGADACSKTGISSLIGQTEGTMFAEFNAKGAYDSNNMLASLSDGTATNRIFLNLTNGVGNLEVVITTAGTTSVNFAGATPSIGNHKVAIAYKANDVVVYLDGVLFHSDNTATIPATSKFNLGSYVDGTLPFNSGMIQSLLFKTRLTNAELAELTTL